MVIEMEVSWANLMLIKDECVPFKNYEKKNKVAVYNLHKF